MLFYEEAEELCQRLSLGGRAWRLPTLSELQSLTVCPDGNPPQELAGCTGPHFGASYNFLWFPGEGDSALAADYWIQAAPDSPDRSRFTMNSGASSPASLQKDRLRVRCVSDGTPKAQGPDPLLLPEPDPRLGRLLVVGSAGAPAWTEPSINASATGAFTASQLLLVGDAGPGVRYQDKEEHFVRVQGLPWTGWTIEAFLEPLPPSATLEAIDAVWATWFSEEGLFWRERLVPGQQYRLLGTQTGGIVQIQLLGRQAEAPAHAFRIARPEEHICKRRIRELEQPGPVPPMMEALWPQDPQSCEHYEAQLIAPIFPNSKNVWKLHRAEGALDGFEGFLVDGIAMSLAANGQLWGSNGNVCHLQGERYVCLW
jgi:hypothetical protein